MSEFCFEKAERQAAPVTIAIIGKSGSGKTYSALKLARGLVGDSGKIAVIDTEGKRACMYAGNPEIGDFAHLDFRPPYSSDRFKEAVKKALDAGYGAIIIDSASHEHEGDGGMLDFAENEERRLTGKTSQRKWVKPKNKHNSFVRFAVGCPAHVIFCLRMKTVSKMAPNGKDMIEVDSAVCEKNMMYEMTLSIELGSEGESKHRANYIKVPEPFREHIRNGEVITVEHGRLLANQANIGVKNNPDLNTWIDACEDEAAKGTESFRAYWPTLRAEQKAALKPYAAGFKQIADDADAAAQATAEREARHAEYEAAQEN